MLVATSCRTARTTPQGPPEHGAGAAALAPVGPPAAQAVSAPRCLPPAKQPPPLHASSADDFPSADCLARVEQLVARMSLEEKLGQMLQPERGNVRPGDIQRFGFGSILSGGGSAPPDNTAAGWARMVTDFREQSLRTRLTVPLLYGVDAVHGHNNVKGAVIFPHSIGLGATRDPDLVRRIGRATALEVAATGIDWTFAPVVTAARDERWGRTYEAFGEAPELSELLAPALIQGLQGEQLGARPDSVLACAKHYVGDGYTRGGDDQGDSQVTADLVKEQLLPAYAKAIAAGVGSIMVSFSSINGVKMHCHGPLMSDTLKGELGFAGLLISDFRGIEQLPGDPLAQLEAAINAGIDMVMAPSAYAGSLEQLRKLVPHRVSMARIDNAVTRILNVKCALGRVDAESFRRTSSRELGAASSQALVGSAPHRLLAREAVQKSLVLLKNESLLPLDKELGRIHLAGSHADDLGNQCGGWTITWQGQSGTPTLGTTLRRAFEAAVGPATRVTYSRDGSGAAGADVAVVALGERPYAEGHGDDAKLELDRAELDVLRSVKAAGVPVVVVLMTGRPVLLGEVLPLADALVAAWLPGSEGEGITDVLFGAEDFSGVLPHSWPRHLAQVPINVGDADYDPLFPYGFGLRYDMRPTQPAAK